VRRSKFHRKGSYHTYQKRAKELRAGEDSIKLGRMAVSNRIFPLLEVGNSRSG